VDTLTATKESQTTEDIQYLAPQVIADVISKELLNSQVIDEREYVRKLEWNVYEDFAKVRDSGIKAP